MAWLETKGKVFRIRFRFGGDKQVHALKISDEREARDALVRFEEHCRLIDRGIIAAPPDAADVGVYIMSGGKYSSRPSQEARPKPPTLEVLLRSYQEEFPKTAKEASTQRIEKIHIAHLKRLLNTYTALTDVNSRTIQAYIHARSRERGRGSEPVRSETVQKEIGTLSAVWNKWGVPQGLIDGPAPTRGLIYPKRKAKPPFQIREQIERQIGRQRLSPEQQSELWRCLFLTLPEVEEVLALVLSRRGPAYLYPMFVFAAHTGARRSEIRRSLISDFDFEENVVLIREKKKDHSQEETYRTVPMSSLLKQTMKEWFSTQSGHYAISTKLGKPLTDHRATEAFHGVLAGSRWSVISGFHVFRHSFISNCVAKGIDQRLIDHWVGHTTEDMRKRYSHLIPKTSQAAMLSVFGKPG